MSKFSDLTGKRFGKLTVLEKTGEQEDRYWTWRCHCDCGNQCVITSHSLHYNKRKSCGCVRQERQENLHDTMTFVDHTCLEVLERRKSRSNNTSGFRGVSRGPDNKRIVTIGLQNKRYYIGLFSKFEDAVKARLRIEEVLHDGFVEACQTWQDRAKTDDPWAAKHPLYLNVMKNGQDLHIDTVFGSQVISAV